MKFVNSYENFYLDDLSKFKAGDYVRLSSKHDWNVFIIAKILGISNPSFYVETIGLGDNIFTFWLDEDDIERKATPEEKEEYILKINANKYNL